MHIWSGDGVLNVGALDACYACLADAPPGRRIVLVRGAGGGYLQTGLDHPGDLPEIAKRNVEWLNRRLGVSAQDAEQKLAAAIGQQETTN